MKKIVITLLLISSVAFSQVEKKLGEFTKVTSFDKIDVTNTLSQEEQTTIKNRLSEQIFAEKKLKEEEKAQKKAEKRIKAAEKKQKKAEKQLKANEKAKKNYADVQEKYEKELKRHKKLSDKGKLSPEDEIKWQKKLLFSVPVFLVYLAHVF